MASRTGLTDAAGSPRAATTFRMGTYNLENYLDLPSGTRKAKTAESKETIRRSIREMQADILALQEVGSRSALTELISSLASEGMKFPWFEFVEGYDTNIHVAVLSRFPILERRSHTNASFLLNGRRFKTSRGFGEVDIQVTPSYRVTVFAVHLKSKREVGYADQNEFREQEALVLRTKIDARLALDPLANILVAGDLNDFKNSKAVRALIGRGNHSLVDLRPVERAPGTTAASFATLVAQSRTIAWTHFYATEDTYGRLDYLLASRGLARESMRNDSFVLAFPEWGLASDHRPVVAEFSASDR